MKQLKLLFSFLAIALLFGFSSCTEEDKRVFGDDIDIPELTDANTIEFTVDATGKWSQLEIIAIGGRMAIEWGDGRLQKVAKVDALPISYRYTNKKTYRVRIWAEELELCNIGGSLLPVSHIRMGYLPKMKDLNLNSFMATSALNLSASCPNLESVNIGNWTDLEEIDLSGCLKLQRIDIYTHPQLTSLKLGPFLALRDLSCFGNDKLHSLSVKGLTALTDVNLSNNSQLSAIDMDDKMNINTVDISGCAFRALDFLSKCPLLYKLDCSFNELTALDVSAFSSLIALHCRGNKELTHLQIPAQSNLQLLSCGLCKLDKDALNIVFTALPIVYQPSGHPSRYRISYSGNPGAKQCDEQILKDKNWSIEE